MVAFNVAVKSIRFSVPRAGSNLSKEWWKLEGQEIIVGLISEYWTRVLLAAKDDVVRMAMTIRDISNKSLSFISGISLQISAILQAFQLRHNHHLSSFATFVVRFCIVSVGNTHLGSRQSGNIGSCSYRLLHLE